MGLVIGRHWTFILFVDGMRRSQASIGTGHIYDD